MYHMCVLPILPAPPPIPTHSFDPYTCRELAAQCNFPWLMANVLDAASGGWVTQAVCSCVAPEP